MPGPSNLVPRQPVLDAEQRTPSDPPTDVTAALGRRLSADRSAAIAEAMQAVLEVAFPRSLKGAAGIESGELLRIELDGYVCVVSRADRAEPVATGTATGTATAAAAGELSPREYEIVRMVSQGLTNTAIANVLDISPWTVGTHLRRIFNKFHVNSRAAMVAHFLGADDA